MKHWTLYNANNEIIGAGDGAVQVESGERLVYSDQDEGNVEFLLNSLKTKGDIYNANSLNDDRVLEEKYYTAIKYLTEVTRPLPYDDPNVINPVNYPVLYDEYWATYDLTPFTPSELAGEIVKRFQEKIASGTYKTPSMKEAERRRSKLIAEKELLKLTVNTTAIPLATESSSE